MPGRNATRLENSGLKLTLKSISQECVLKSSMLMNLKVKVCSLKFIS